jgi:adenylate kinase family enzyme
VKRVLILGCPASGKSTLARELARRTGLPLVHLDRVFWRPNWVQATEEQFQASLAVELKKPKWIMDGNYGRTIVERLEFADTAILLDFSRWLCFWRAAKRSLVGLGRTRPDMGDECREKFDPEFFYFIWRFRRDHIPKVMDALDRFPGEKVVLRSPSEVRRFLASLRS